jgi:hypothetical protein
MRERHPYVCGGHFDLLVQRYLADKCEALDKMLVKQEQQCLTGDLDSLWDEIHQRFPKGEMSIQEYDWYLAEIEKIKQEKQR